MKQVWTEKNLSEVCQIELGKTPLRRNKKFWDSEKKTNNVWLSISDLLNTNGNVVSDSKEYISDEGASISKIVKAGTLLVSFKLTLGRLAFAGRDLYTNEAIAALTIKNEEELSKEFLYYFLSFFDWDAATKGDIKVKGKTLNKEKLKVIEIKYPSISEQHRIVKILDEVFSAIDKAIESAEMNLQNAKEIFKSYLQNVFSNPGDDWEEKKIAEVCAEIFAGGDAPKGNYSKVKTEEYSIPIYANAVKIKGLYGYTNFARVTKPSITVAARGSGTGHTEIRNESFLPIVRLIVLIPNTSEVILEFLKHAIDSLVILKGGSAIPQLTVPMIKEYKIFLPPIHMQKEIIAKLEGLITEIQELEEIYNQKLDNLEELKKSILQKAFNGEL